METTGMKSIKGFPNYSCTKYGRIFSHISNKYLKDHDNGHGYRYLILRNGGKSYNKYVHRLVCQSYLGGSELEVNHKDGDKSNNSLSNLEYVTSSENTVHGFANNLMHTVPITLEKDGVGHWFPTQVTASQYLGVSKSAINAVSRGRNKTVAGYSLPKSK